MNHKTPTHEEKMRHLAAMLEDMGSVMMTTSASGTLEDSRTRPMSVAKRDGDGTLYFLTSAETSQVKDARAAEIGICTTQSKTEYVALRGTFVVQHDRALIEELWSKWADAYFPKGKEDPSIRIMTFRPKTAELWDMSGPKGIAYLIDVAKALLTKAPPKASPEAHAKIVIARP